MMTTQQAAGMLKVTPRRITQLIACGRIKATKQGRDWLIAPEEVDRYAQDRKPAGRPKEK